jgi:thiol-disulfide isomerase/thioredoxin
MRNVLFFICLLFSLQAGAQGIDFHHGTLDEAKKLSGETGKLIFIDCYTSWCGPCKRMSSQVFTRDDVGAVFNQNFINCKIDMEKGEGPSVAGTYGIRAYPTFLFIDAEGKLIERKVGGMTPESFIEFGKEVALKNDQSPKYAAKYEAGDHSPELVYNYIKALNDANKSSAKVANDYFKSKSNFDTEWDYKIIFESTSNLDSKAAGLFEKYDKQIAKVYSDIDMYNKRKQLVDNTIQRGIDYQSKQLIDQAGEFAAKNLSKEDAEFLVAKGHFLLSDSKKDQAGVKSGAETLAKIANEKNKFDLAFAIYILKAKYSAKPAMQSALLGLYQKQADITNKPSDRVNYAMYLLSAGQKDKALSEAEKAKSRAAELKEDTASYDQVIIYIKSK